MIRLISSTKTITESQISITFIKMKAHFPHLNDKNNHTFKVLTRLGITVLVVNIR